MMMLVERADLTLGSWLLIMDTKWSYSSLLYTPHHLIHRHSFYRQGWDCYVKKCWSIACKESVEGIMLRRIWFLFLHKHILDLYFVSQSVFPRFWSYSPGLLVGVNWCHLSALFSVISNINSSHTPPHDGWSPDPPENWSPHVQTVLTFNQDQGGVHTRVRYYSLTRSLGSSGCVLTMYFNPAVCVSILPGFLITYMWSLCRQMHESCYLTWYIHR